METFGEGVSPPTLEDLTHKLQSFRGLRSKYVLRETTLNQTPEEALSLPLPAWLDMDFV